MVTKTESMDWGTISSSYGSFYPQWKRSYLTHLPDRERERTRINMTEQVKTTQNEYGQWYAMAKGTPRDAFLARDPYPYTRNNEPTYFPKPWSAAKSLPMTVRTPLTPRLPPLTQRDDFSRGANVASRTVSRRGSRSRISVLQLPDVKNVDVQMLTTDNTLVSVAPVSDCVEKYSYPRTVNEVALPNIREINIKFNLKNDQSVDLRAVPILDD